MDFYVFPALPMVETRDEKDCIIYYLQFEHLGFERFERTGLTGAVGNVEKMLRPLKVRTFQVRSPGDVRRALAKVMEEAGKL
jgi:hypothetical protein